MPRLPSGSVVSPDPQEIRVVVDSLAVSVRLGVELVRGLAQHRGTVLGCDRLTAAAMPLRDVVRAGRRHVMVAVVVCPLGELKEWPRGGGPKGMVSRVWGLSVRMYGVAAAAAAQVAHRVAPYMAMIDLFTDCKVRSSSCNASASRFTCWNARYATSRASRSSAVASVAA